jgi:hypothetical protein
VRNLSFLFLDLIVRIAYHWRQPPLFPICLSRHGCEIRRRGYHFLVYHKMQNNGSFILHLHLHPGLFDILPETSSATVCPLSIMPVGSVYSLEVSGINFYFFRHLDILEIWGIIIFTFYRLNSLPRVPLPGSTTKDKGMYDRSEGLLVLIYNIRI